LKQFEKREGHCNVTKSHTEDGVKLGAWVRTQRRLHKMGELHPEKQMMLEEIGFTWGLGHRPRVPWEARLDLLKQFQMREGHCNVPHSHKEDGDNLGRWVSTQRENKRLDKLALYRQKHPEDVGF
jgi:hypothetical protein